VLKKSKTMRKLKTHFEQVPVRVVRKILHLDETPNPGPAKSGVAAPGKKKFASAASGS
jgi:hypothetical protein